jgi:hypothetical protein
MACNLSVKLCIKILHGKLSHKNVGKSTIECHKVNNIFMGVEWGLDPLSKISA